MLVLLALLAPHGFAAPGGRLVASPALLRSAKTVMSEPGSALESMADLQAGASEIARQQAEIARELAELRAESPTAPTLPPMKLPTELPSITAAPADVPAAAPSVAISPPDLPSVTALPAPALPAPAPELPASLPELPVSLPFSLPSVSLPDAPEPLTRYIDADMLPIVAASTLLPVALLLGLMTLDGLSGLSDSINGKKKAGPPTERSLPPLAADDAESQSAWGELGDESFDDELSALPAILSVKSALEALSPEEQRKLKLEVGTNWPPRTTTAKPFAADRAGFMFFQGPTPLTAVQEGMPGYFSKENFEGLEVPRKLLVAGGVFGATLLALAVSLAIGSGVLA